LDLIDHLRIKPVSTFDSKKPTLCLFLKSSSPIEALSENYNFFIKKIKFGSNYIGLDFFFNTFFSKEAIVHSANPSKKAYFCFKHTIFTTERRATLFLYNKKITQNFG